MKKTCLPLALSALIGSLAIPTAASANDMVDNWLNSLYVSTFLGGHFLPDIVTDTSYTTDARSFEETYEQEAGFAVRFAVGGHVSSYLRTEFELGFSRSNQGSILEVINGALPGTIHPGHGQIDAISLMGNVWTDLPVFDNAWGLTPYVGGGIGAALVQSNMVYTASPAYGPQDSSVQFAAQLGAGINWAFSDRFAAGLGYRLMFINGPETSQTTTPAGEITTYRFDDLLSQSVGITLTMNLN